MTPSKQAKALGLESLKQVSLMTGISYRALYDWAKDRPAQFEITLLGCIAKLDQNKGWNESELAARQDIKQEISQYIRDIADEPGACSANESTRLHQYADTIDGFE